MNYWWVNHKQTFRQEFGGGYIWCPKSRVDGTVHHFYETVREVRPGDMILSYARAAVQGFGFATTHCYSCPQPDEFGKVGAAWDMLGWRVDVHFIAFNTPLRTADYSKLIAPFLPKKYSPIREDGFGNQGAYFSEINRALVLKIAELGAPELGRVLNQVADTPNQLITEVALDSIQAWEDQEQDNIWRSDHMPETTRKALVQARIGQGQFKKNVYIIEKECRVTHVRNPTHLIASHIKPWRESNNEERLHDCNGLMLTPSIDHLFDRGFISFDDGGDLITSPVADDESLRRMGIDTREPINVGRFNIDQQYFLKYHRKEILLKSAA